MFKGEEFTTLTLYGRVERKENSKGHHERRHRILKVVLSFALRTCEIPFLLMACSSCSRLARIRAGPSTLLSIQRIRFELWKASMLFATSLSYAT